MTQSSFEHPMMPREIADAPDIDNVPAADSMHTLMGTVMEMHYELRQIGAHLGIDRRAPAGASEVGLAAEIRARAFGNCTPTPDGVLVGRDDLRALAARADALEFRVKAAESAAWGAAKLARQANEAEDQVERVRALHTLDGLEGSGDADYRCTECGQGWPCETTQALGGTQ